MEKINIAELLRHAPSGMELDCVLFDDSVKVIFDKVDETLGFVKIVVIRKNNRVAYSVTKYGQWDSLPYHKCVIFPKGRTTWEGFVPPCDCQDGDVIYVKTRLSQWISIFKEDTGDGIATYADYCLSNRRFYGINDDSRVLCQNNRICEKRLATEEEKQKLFKVINNNGYKWNPVTKTLDGLFETKFKVGDKIRRKGCDKAFLYEISNVYDDSYGLVGFSWVLYKWHQDEYELVPDKFDISTLNPFDKVLTRDNDSQKWGAELFSFYDNESEDYRFQLVGIVYARYCIPYEGNEHLLGTTNDCDEYYKNW